MKRHPRKDDPEAWSERWRIHRQAYQPLPTESDVTFKLGVTWETGDLGDDYGPVLETGFRARRALAEGREKIGTQGNQGGHAKLSDADLRRLQEALNEQRNRSPQLSNNGMIAAATRQTGLSESTVRRYIKKGSLTIPPRTDYRPPPTREHFFSRKGVSVFG